MINLTKDEREKVVKLMHCIFQEVGSDLLQCCGTDYICGTDLRDVALDLIYERMQRNDCNAQNINKDWKPIISKWYSLTPGQRYNIAKQAFPNRKYS